MAFYRTVLTGSTLATKFANGTQVRSSGLTGTLSQRTESAGGFRDFRLPAEEDISPGFRDALEELELQEQETLYFDVVRAPAGGGMRSAAAADLVVLEPAPPSSPRGSAVQVVLYQDESGGLSWHFPDGFESPAAASPGVPPSAMRDARRMSFTIPARTLAARESLAANQPPTHLRGPITKIGRKIFKVIVVPLLAPLLGDPIREIAGKMERKYRQNLIRAVTPENYRTPVSTPFTDWDALDGKRALLVVHGIFSSTHGVLSGCPKSEIESLAAHYGGRMIALDQFTVTMSPEDNARFFLEQARQGKPGGRFEFDVLCHSRGGVVSRALAERGEVILPGHNCAFRKVYFVASPNAGSALGDPRHMVDMLDVFTNIATKFPDGPVTYGIEVLLALVKLLAYTAITELPGVAAMGTAGYIADTLNASRTVSPAEYAASAADYEPSAGKDNGFLLDTAGDFAMDRIFQKDGVPVGNDLVVPTGGVWERNGHPSFPIRDRVVYGAAEGVYHTTFFSQPRTLAHLNGFYGLSSTPILLKTDAAEKLRAEYDFDRLADYSRGAGAGAGAGFPDSAPPLRRFRTFSAPPGPERDSLPRGFPLLRSLPASPAEAAPAESAPQPAALVRRKPQIAFHEAVEEGAVHPLVVSLEQLYGIVSVDLGRTLELSFADGQEWIDLQVLLHAPGFDVAPLVENRVRVFRQRDPKTEHVTFSLTARSPGPGPARREIRAEFWWGNTCVGTVLHRTFVMPRGYSGGWQSDGSSAFQPLNVPAVRREECDLVLIVEGEDDTGQPPFRLRLQCALPGHEYAAKPMGKMSADQTGASLSDYIHSVIDGIFANVPAAPRENAPAPAVADYNRALGEWEVEFARKLTVLGKRLWDWLPEKLRLEYFRLRDTGLPIRSILVHSDEMVIPWELVVPHRAVNGKLEVSPRLGEAHVLGRWKPGLTARPQPQRLTVRNLTIVNPSYAAPDELPAAQEEAAELKRLFPKASRLAPASASLVLKLLDEGDDVQLLHLCCHGDFTAANADLSTVFLENGGRLQALDLKSARLIVERSPFVYLNACSVGSVGGVAGRIGGFAAVLLESGCSGLIAPYWRVDDVHAKEFSLALYEKLMTGIAVGEALQELRAERPDDITFRAFALYGDPWTRLNLQPLLA